jgi:hypothetical protein
MQFERFNVSTALKTEEHGVTESTDTNLSKERNGQKNNKMMEAVEINLHSFHCLVFLLLFVSPLGFFETSGSV